MISVHRDSSWNINLLEALQRFVLITGHYSLPIRSVLRDPNRAVHGGLPRFKSRAY